MARRRPGQLDAEDSLPCCRSCKNKREYRTSTRTEGGGQVPQKECPYCGHPATRLKLPRLRKTKKDQPRKAA